MAITIVPLMGAQDSSRTLSYLLEIDEGRILLDCGFLDRPSREQVDKYLGTLSLVAPQLDLVLLSHPLLSALGLVPFLRARLGVRCPIYATLPTKEMGRWATEEWIGQRAAEESSSWQPTTLARAHTPSLPSLSHSRKANEGAFDDSPNGLRATEDDADPDLWDQTWKISFKELRDAFDGIVAVRYSQPIYLGGKLRPLTLTAHKSGHTLGGTIWTLRSPLHTVSSASSSTLIYAPFFNHVRERHLDSAALVQGTGEGGMRIGLGMSRPMVMVVGSERSLIKGARKKDRERAFLDCITETVRSSHSVLIPTDPSARLIELLLILDSHWTSARLDSVPLCVVSRTGKDVITFIRSLTEWMSPALAKPTFEPHKRHSGRDQNDQGPLRLRHVRFYTSLNALEADLPLNQPKVLLTVPMSMEYGYSRSMFVKMASVEGNLIVLTSGSATRAEKCDRFSTLAGWLANCALETDEQNSSNIMGEDLACNLSPTQLNTKVNVELRAKVLLEGEELEQYLEEERRTKERKAKAAALLARSRQIIEEETDDTASESDSDAEATAVTRTLLGGGPGWDEFVDEKEPMAFDIYVKGGSATRFGGGKTQRFRMFPIVERRRKIDGYGEVVDVDGWLKRGDAVDDAISKVEGGSAKVVAEDTASSIPVESPSKCITHIQKVDLRCKVLRIDLEGKADGRALKTIVPQINPKTIVLINGSPESTKDLAGSIAAVPTFTRQIFHPSVAERATVGHDTKSFSVRLGDSIMNSIRFSQVDGFEVAHVSGRLEIPDESLVPTIERHRVDPPKKIRRTSLLQQGQAGAQDAEVKRLEPLTSISKGSSIFIGDLRLAELKAYLISMTIPAEFAAEGVLVCGPVKLEHTFKLMETNLFQGHDPKMDMSAKKQLVGGTTAVRKTVKGQLIIEGAIGVTFLLIKDAVYNLHARTRG